MVLVAEDDPAIRDMVRVLLEMDGFEVLEAEAGDKAAILARTRLHSLAALLTDVRMPGLTGPELARGLRQDRPELPVVFMSGYVGDAACGYDSDLARSEFVAKPFKLEDLRAAVRRAARKSSPLI